MSSLLGLPVFDTDDNVAITIVSGTDRLLVVWVQGETGSGGSGDYPSDITVSIADGGGGTALTAGIALATQAGTGYACYQRMFYLLDTDFPSNASRVITATLTGGTLQGKAINAAMYEGVKQAAPDDTSVASYTSGTNPFVASLTPVAAGLSTICGIKNGSDTVDTSTLTAGYTVEFDERGNSADTQFLLGYDLDASGGQTVNLTWAAGSSVGLMQGACWEDVATGLSIPIAMRHFRNMQE